MTESRMARPADLDDDPDAAARDDKRLRLDLNGFGDSDESRDEDFALSGAIVPASSISGRALFFVLAIMSFLACITVGAVAVIATAAADWQSDISGEITVQVRPLDGLDVGAAVADTLKIVRGMPGVVAANAMTDDELRTLLEPWLGGGVDLDELPVPRLIIIEIDRAAPPDTGLIRRKLAQAVPSASLDDHELWQERLSVMANTLAISGGAILLLVLVATVLSVVFATRGAMATNRDIVEVLHLVGAKEAFIAREFERHFLRLGFRGGLTGGLAAIASFIGIRWSSSQFTATPAGNQFEALFGGLTIGWPAFAGIALTILLVASLTAMSSRLAVYGMLKVFD